MFAHPFRPVDAVYLGRAMTDNTFGFHIHRIIRWKGILDGDSSIHPEEDIAVSKVLDEVDTIVVQGLGHTERASE